MGAGASTNECTIATSRRQAIKTYETTSFMTFLSKKDSFPNELKPLLFAALSKLYCVESSAVLHEGIANVMCRQLIEPSTILLTENVPGDSLYFVEKGELQVSIQGVAVHKIVPGLIFGELAVLYDCLRTATVTSITECIVWSLSRSKLRHVQSQYQNKIQSDWCQMIHQVPMLYRTFSSDDFALISYSMNDMHFEVNDQIYGLSRQLDRVLLVLSGTVRVNFDISKVKEVPNKVVKAFNNCKITEKDVFEGKIEKILDILGIFVPEPELKKIQISTTHSADVDVSGSYSMELGAGSVLGLSWISLMLNGEYSMVSFSNVDTFTCWAVTDMVVCSQFTSEAFTKVLYNPTLRKKLNHSTPNTKRDDVTETITQTEKSRFKQRNLDVKGFFNLELIKETEFGSYVMAKYDKDVKTREDKDKKKKDKIVMLRVLSKTRLVKAGCIERLQQEKEILEVLDYPFLSKFYGSFSTVDEIVLVSDFFLSIDLWSLLYEREVREFMYAEYSSWSGSNLSLSEALGSYIPAAQQVNVLSRTVSGMFRTASSKRMNAVTTGGLPLPLVKFYAASIVCVLHYLSRLKIVHRNISLENVLIGPSGYIKVVGFSLAKRLPYQCDCIGDFEETTTPRRLVPNRESSGLFPMSPHHSSKKLILKYRTYTFCGKLDYLSPEIISGAGHDTTSDLWAFGVVLFELLFGYTPFAPHVGSGQMSGRGTSGAASSKVTSTTISRVNSDKILSPSLGSGYMWAKPLPEHEDLCDLDSDDYSSVDDGSPVQVLVNIMKTKSPSFTVERLVPGGLDKSSTHYVDAIDILSKLFRFFPGLRLGAKSEDASAVLDHKFFEAIELETLMTGKFQTTPPFRVSHDLLDVTRHKLIGLPKFEQYSGEQGLFDSF